MYKQVFSVSISTIQIKLLNKNVSKQKYMVAYF